MAVDKLIWKMILDFFILVCVSFPLLGIMLWVEPYQRGYFINDTSILLPYKEETVSVATVAGAGFALIVVTVLIVEIIRDRKGNNIGEKFLSGSVIPGWVWESYQTIGVFTFGAACQQLTSDLAKYVIGRLRPHFMDVCKPVPILPSIHNTLGYIQDYICAENDNERVKEARLSFPSAHASFSMYCAVFFIPKDVHCWTYPSPKFCHNRPAWQAGWRSQYGCYKVTENAVAHSLFYLQVKGKWRGSKLFRHGLQYAVMISAWFVGLTRVQDHMHHWSDVTVGFLIGAIYACLVFIFVLKPKKYSPLPMTWEEPQLQPTNPLPRAVLAR